MTAAAGSCRKNGSDVDTTESAPQGTKGGGKAAWTTKIKIARSVVLDFFELKALNRFAVALGKC